jgi:hypothetical protein
MIRTLAGVAAGIALAIVLMMLVEALGNMMFPPPALDLNNPNAPAILPLPNQLFPVLGWFLAALCGGWLALQVSARAWTSWLVAASVLVGEILDFALGRHAVWVMIAGIVAPLLGAWLAQKLPRRAERVSA